MATGLPLTTRPRCCAGWCGLMVSDPEVARQVAAALRTRCGTPQHSSANLCERLRTRRWSHGTPGAASRRDSQIEPTC